jgi:hypothetical protein
LAGKYRIIWKYNRDTCQVWMIHIRMHKLGWKDYHPAALKIH